MVVGMEAKQYFWITLFVALLLTFQWLQSSSPPHTKNTSLDERKGSVVVSWKKPHRREADDDKENHEENSVTQQSKTDSTLEPEEEAIGKSRQNTRVFIIKKNAGTLRTGSVSSKNHAEKNRWRANVNRTDPPEDDAEYVSGSQNTTDEILVTVSTDGKCSLNVGHVPRLNLRVTSNTTAAGLTNVSSTVSSRRRRWTDFRGAVFDHQRSVFGSPCIRKLEPLNPRLPFRTGAHLSDNCARGTPRFGPSELHLHGPAMDFNLAFLFTKQAKLLWTVCPPSPHGPEVAAATFTSNSKSIPASAEENPLLSATLRHRAASFSARTLPPTQTESARLSTSLRRLYIDLGGNAYHTSVQHFLRTYPNASSFDIIVYEVQPKHWPSYPVHKPTLTLVPMAVHVETGFMVFHKQLCMDKFFHTKEEAEKEKEANLRDPQSEYDAVYYPTVGIADAIHAAVFGVPFTPGLPHDLLRQIVSKRSASSFDADSGSMKTEGVEEIDFDSIRAQTFVVVKMDIEGIEWPVIDKMLQLGLMGLVDELFIECHNSEWNPNWPTNFSQKDCHRRFHQLRRDAKVYVHEWY